MGLSLQCLSPERRVWVAVFSNAHLPHDDLCRRKPLVSLKPFLKYSGSLTNEISAYKDRANIREQKEVLFTSIAA